MTKDNIFESTIYEELPWNLYRSLAKPLIDWIIALFALILLSPLFFIVAIAIKLDSKGPVFFLQKRLGRYGKEYKIIKFRSMNNVSTINSGNKLFEHDPRITRVGNFIRKTSIDELSQIINILLGNMSFIGPRPPVTYFPKKISEYNKFEFQRFLVKPGISGLAAIRCREIHDWEVNIPIDVEYVHKVSFLFDLKLFIASLKVFFITDNIYRKE